MNFAGIAFLDTFELTASLRTRMGLFRGAGDLRTLPIRGPRQNADDPDDDLGFVFYKEAAKWAELKTMLGRIKRLGDQPPGAGVEYGRIFMEMLQPGGFSPWTLEDSAYNARFMRAHMALRSSPWAILYSGTESMRLIPGDLTVVNHRVRHSAVNFGEWPRIHLVVDFRRTDGA